jgi:hypothetical protein
MAASRLGRPNGRQNRTSPAPAVSTDWADTDSSSAGFTGLQDPDAAERPGSPWNRWAHRHRQARAADARVAAPKRCCRPGPNQLAAVAHGAGLARIVTPAGSGKTLVLTQLNVVDVMQGVAADRARTAEALTESYLRRLP